MTTLRTLLADWWPLLLPLVALVLVLAATAISGFFGAVLLAVAFLQIGTALASLVGKALRRIAARYPKVEESRAQ